MKKKIIYISGAEVFDVDEVRAAFEEVRAALKLDRDTILFGVSVDAENVCEKTVDSCLVDDAECLDDSDCVCEQIEEDNVDEIVQEPEFIDETPEDTKEDSEIESVQKDNLDEQKAESDDAEKTDDEVVLDKKDDAVAPILTFLAAKPVEETETDKETMPDENVDVEIESEQTLTINAGANDMPEMINDEMPVDQTEKTLEELLESMTPLQEDVQPDSEKLVENDTNLAKTNEIDITLENLASEFAESQDKIVPQKKTSERGKIGKLKNILPFKKMKRDDSGIMGDLFGWAGVAANDDDFSMPGFFTNAK